MRLDERSVDDEIDMCAIMSRQGVEAIDDRFRRHGDIDKARACHIVRPKCLEGLNGVFADAAEHHSWSAGENACDAECPRERLEGRNNISRNPWPTSDDYRRAPRQSRLL